MSNRLMSLALVSLFVVTGCGMNPASVKKVKKTNPANVVRMQQGAPTPAMAPGQVAPEVGQMLAALRQAQQQAPGFTATVETYDKGPSGKESITMKVAYRKPSSLRIEMTKATGQAQGAKILWTGGSTLSIKPSFLPMTVEKSISDAMVKSKNGWTLRETEVNAIFKVMFDPAAQIKPLGVQPVAGMAMGLFEVRSAASPAGATHEVVGINPQTGLPGTRMIYKHAELLYQITLKHMQVKAPSASEMAI